MKQKIARFMYGRYGVDQLSRSMMVMVIVLVILGIFFKTRLIDWASTLLLILTYFRMFSKNINKRYQENMKYMVVHNKMMAKYNGWMEAFACRKTTKSSPALAAARRFAFPRERGR